jgi:hypothetical protein
VEGTTAMDITTTNIMTVTKDLFRLGRVFTMSLIAKTSVLRINVQKRF